MPPVSELSFRRAIINLADAGRLGEGEDLNDAILDFFIRLGQFLIPEGGDANAPVSYLGSIFWKQLRSAYASSGEDGWKNVQNWAKRKAGGLFKASFGAFAVPINEDLKDDKGNDAGNHWWLALVLNPPGGAMKEPTAVMCLDSMQRRTKKFDEPLSTTQAGTMHRYSVEVTEVEQAGYLLIITFEARGDGSFGPLPRPEKSRLLVDGYACVDPTLGLRINMPGDDGVAGRFQGTLTFAMDGRCRSSAFEFIYADDGYGPIKIEFDPFQLTKLQKDVSRYLGGYLAKEWEMNGPQKGVRFEKMSTRALVADVHQQENLNDCGVYVLENTLRALRLKKEFLKTMAEASSQVLSKYPWPSQKDITARKLKLKGIVARLFSAAAEKGITDVEKLLKEDDTLKKEVLESLTEARDSEVDKFASDLHKELAARTADKEKEQEELRRREEAVQARREEERAKREEAARKAEEERLELKWSGGPRKVEEKKKKKASRSKSGSDMSMSRSRSRGKDRNAKGRSKKRAASSSQDSRRPAKGGSKKRATSPSEDSRRPGKSVKRNKSNGGGGRRRGGRGASDSRSRSPSRRRRR
mmetsp:Transcript_22926/g.66273  ORF Transcript_22926/g.66273 Transcript_22926/m.66273 type:complete len:584 (-) Transcript_22926:272-2023(-)